jgi:hypothetical protein
VAESGWASGAMRLELPVLENFLQMTSAAGNEVLYTVLLPSGEKKTIDMNLLFREVHDALRALEHFLDLPYKAANPTGQEAIGGR